MELTGLFVTETIVKKSRFITSARKAASAADAKAFIKLVQEADASHNCWAYRIDDDTFRYSDDGEPSGTAGKPIFTAICSSDVQCVVVVVTRYFGGTKLGAGGLIRAYNSAAAQCLREAPKVIREVTQDFDISVKWANIGAVQGIVERLERLETVFNEEGCTITVRIPGEDAETFQKRIIDVCSGAVKIRTSTVEKDRPKNS